MIDRCRADLHQQALDAAREEGRRAGLEEAVKVADNMASRRFTQDMREMLQMCAAAIRALIDKPADPVAEAKDLQGRK